MTPGEFLLKYAAQREKSFRYYPQGAAEKLKAISRIKQVAGHFVKSKNSNWIEQIKPEILKVLPDPESRFKKLREKTLKLINNEKQQKDNENLV